MAPNAISGASSGPCSVRGLRRVLRRALGERSCVRVVRISAPGPRIGRIMPRQIARAAFRQVLGVYHLLRIGWPSARAFATCPLYCVEAADDPGIVTDAVALLIGF